MEKTKTCTKCGETKPITEFGKNSNSKDGHRPDCKICKRARQNKKYNENLIEKHNKKERAKKHHLAKKGIEYTPNLLKEEKIETVLKVKLPEFVKIHPDEKILKRHVSYKFIDTRYGVFTTTVYALEKNGKSSHPKAVSKRAKETNIKKYNVDNPMKVQEFKEKVVETNIEKYGVANPSYNQKIKNKISEANIENSEERMKKLKATTLKKYGVENIAQYTEFRLKKSKHVLGDETVRELALMNDKDYTTAVKFYKNLTEEEFRMWLVSPRSKNNLESILSTVLGVEKYDRQYKKKAENIFKPDFKVTENLYVNTDGLWWHCENFTKDKKQGHKYHYRMREEFEKNGDTILMFYADEIYDNLPIVKSIINAKLGKFDKRLYARETELRKVNFKEAEKFFDDNHLMGGKGGYKALGLYYNDELVCCVGYKKHEEGCDITRFCTKLNTQVVGGMSKLFSYIEKNNDYKYIQYMVDLRYGRNSVESLGFTLEGITLGFCWTDKNRRFNRRQIQGKNQSQQAAERGWYKIYDAGQAKYIKHLN